MNHLRHEAMAIRDKLEQSMAYWLESSPGLLVAERIITASSDDEIIRRWLGIAFLAGAVAQQEINVRGMTVRMEELIKELDNG